MQSRMGCASLRAAVLAASPLMRCFISQPPLAVQDVFARRTDLEKALPLTRLVGRLRRTVHAVVNRCNIFFLDGPNIRNHDRQGTARNSKQRATERPRDIKKRG